MRIWPTKRRWKRIAIALVAFAAIALIVNGALAWWAERKLQHQYDAIRAKGEPASIFELTPKAIPNHENAAALLSHIAPGLKEFGSENGRFFNTAVGQSYDEAKGRGETPNLEQIAAIRAIVEKYPDVEAAIAAAAECKQYASQLDFSLDQQKFVEAIIEHQSEFRTAARYVNWRIELDLADGNTERAVERGLQLLRLAQLYDNEPSMVSFLVGTAVRQIAALALYDALSAGEVSARTHAAVEAELAQQEGTNRLRQALVTERALATGWYAALTKRQEFFGFASAALGWPYKNYQIGSIELMNEHLKLTEQPWHEVSNKFGGGSPAAPTGHGVMADLLMPGMQAAFVANARNEALMRSLRIYNALREYADKNAREAKGLEELSLSQAATIDPFDGKPLRIKNTDDGWMVYTVMQNGVDDGGDFKELKDYGVAPRKHRRTE